MNYLDILEQINYWGALKKPPGKKRAYYIEKLLKESSNYNVSAVIGVRRSGKSTILLQTLSELILQGEVDPKNTLYVNFEDPRLVSLLSDSQLFNLIDAFDEIADNRSTRYVVFDEIQNVQNWEAQVRTLLDQERYLKIYLTGSSARLLGRELGTKLSGRYLSTEVFPLSYKEYTILTKKLDPKPFIQNGGFPDSVLSSSQDVSQQLLKDYYESILLRDISARYNIRNEFKLRRLASALFSNISNIASSYRLSKDLELSADTVLQYFDHIEDAYLGFFVPQYAVSVRKQEYNPKKFYAIDTGLQAAVSFRNSQDLGKVFENVVFLELRRLYNEIYYWQEEREIDFVIKRGEVVRALVNVCVSLTDERTREREVESLKLAMHQLNKQQSYIVTLEGKKNVLKIDVGTITVLPFEEFVVVPVLD